MITKEELKDIARLTKLKLHQQERDYIQTMILNSIYSSITNELVFKGGTALFFLYKLPRFSEDLDFTMIKKINEKLILSNIVKDLERFGVRTQISQEEEKDISFSFRIDTEGPLFTKQIERCFIRVEISKRENIENFSVKEIKSNYPDIPNFNICVLETKEILAEKIRALLTRTQARDLFDLYFLLKEGTKIDIYLVNKKLFYYRKKFNKREFIDKVNMLRDVWVAELEPFIMGELPTFNIVKKFVLKFF